MPAGSVKRVSVSNYEQLPPAPLSLVPPLGNVTVKRCAPPTPGEWTAVESIPAS
jgi:hypothetical protein